MGFEERADLGFEDGGGVESGEERGEEGEQGESHFPNYTDGGVILQGGGKMGGCWCGRRGLGAGMAAAMRILVVEDEGPAREFLVEGLRENGFAAEGAADGMAGWERARDGKYDLLVLDVMLPVVDGWGLLERLRAGGCGTPALFLTARDSVHDRVRGLELGADDYLVKPFAWVEFLARVRAFQRRGRAVGVGGEQVGDLELDGVLMKARRGGVLLDLTVREYQLLAFMVRHRGETLSRGMLAREVWNMAFGDSNAVDMAVGRLRRKVDEGREVRLIHTVRGAGYVLEERGHE